MSVYDYLKAYTAQALRVSALNKVTANVDKREGSVIFDTISPLSVIAANIIEMMRIALENTNIQTASGQWLDILGQQPPCGVYRNAATKAVKIAVVKPSGVQVPNNTLFTSSGGLGLIWRVSESLGNDRYKVTCEIEGAVGGGDYGELTTNSNIENLVSFSFADEPPFNPGSDEESDDAFRLRIWEALKTDAYGGNFADYKHWVLQEISRNDSNTSFDGMMFYPSSRYLSGGNIKIYPSQTDVNGHKYCPASQIACSSLKEFLDPESEEGYGAGVSPVGHRVDVQSPISDVWDLKITVSMKSGYEIEDYIDKANDRIETYFENVRADLVSKITDSFPTKTGSFAGYKASVTANNIIGYLIPEVECFESVRSVEREVGGEYIDVTEIIYNPTAFDSSLPVIGSIEFEVENNE